MQRLLRTVWLLVYFSLSTLASPSALLSPRRENLLTRRQSRWNAEEERSDPLSSTSAAVDDSGSFRSKEGESLLEQGQNNYGEGFDNKASFLSSAEMKEDKAHAEMKEDNKAHAERKEDMGAMKKHLAESGEKLPDTIKCATDPSKPLSECPAAEVKKPSNCLSRKKIVGICPQPCDHAENKPGRCFTGKEVKLSKQALASHSIAVEHEQCGVSCASTVFADKQVYSPNAELTAMSRGGGLREKLAREDCTR